MPDGDGATPDRYEARVTAAIDNLRGNVKWTLVSFGAIGTTLLAGSQLSNLGKFGHDDPRLWFALGCALVALCSASYAVYSALKVAYTGYTEFYHLEPTDIEYAENNPALLEGFHTVAALRTAYRRCVDERHQALTAAEKDMDAINNLQTWFVYLDGLVDHVVSYVRYNKIRRQVEKTRIELTIASIIAAFALVGFAWAANPASEHGAKAAQNSAATSIKHPIVWTQLRPDTDAAKGELIARAIVARGAECPALTVNGARWPMETRADGSDPDFPIRMCEAALPGDAKAAIGKIELKPRPRALRKILVIGDTGCRITDYTAQACDSAADWPFFRVTKAAAKMQPDLIIHVGDYHYREKPCGGHPGCAGSPYGDNWATWQDEFFTPSAPLLTAAPWLMMRGNHEDCPRAGAGWHLLIQPRLGLPAGAPCPPDADPDLFDFDGMHLVVPDTASADDYGREGRVVTYRNQIRALAKMLKDKSGESWLITHQALWVSYARNGKGYTETDLYGRVAAMADAKIRADLCGQIVSPMDTFRQWIGGKVPLANPNVPGKEQPCAETAPPAQTVAMPEFSLVLSGDTHTFQMFKPDDTQPKNQPVQLVVGNGGDALEPATNYPDAVNKLDTQPADLFGLLGTLWMRNTFGFVVLEKPDGAPAWTATLHDADGKPIVRCTVKRDGGRCEELKS